LKTDPAEERREYEKKKEKRHKLVITEELNKLEDDKDEINTMTWAVKILRDFLADKDMDINFESYTAPWGCSGTQ